MASSFPGGEPDLMHMFMQVDTCSQVAAMDWVNVRGEEYEEHEEQEESDDDTF